MTSPGGQHPVGDLLGRHGYTVYYLGSDDERHLKAARPEDHCPFSTTGYPTPHPYPFVAAVDIMPPKAGSGLPSLQRLGARLIADRNAGVPGISWMKYINHEPDRDDGGRCFHDSWQPAYRRVDSRDRGHLHISAYSTVATSPVATGYDPVARIRAADTPTRRKVRMLTVYYRTTVDGAPARWALAGGNPAWVETDTQAVANGWATLHGSGGSIEVTPAVWESLKAQYVAA